MTPPREPSDGERYHAQDVRELARRDLAKRRCLCGLCRSRRGEPALDLHEADRLLRAKRIGRTHPKQRVAKEKR